MMVQIVTWTVASLPILINGYLLLDFFSSEIRGAVSGSFLCVAVVVADAESSALFSCFQNRVCVV